MNLNYELLFEVGTVFANVALICALLFVASYALFFRWWSRPAGRSIMGFVSVVLALSSLGWLGRILGTDSLAYASTRLAVHGLAMVATGALLWVLWSTWLKTAPEGVEPNEKLVGEIIQNDKDDERKDKIRYDQ